MSFKQLTKDGVLKRADAYKVRYQDIHVADGFNAREHNARLQAHIGEIADFIMAGGQLPPIEVEPHADGVGVVIVDGHCRHAAYGIAIKAGDAIEWIEVKQFTGDAADRTARIVTSNEGLKLTQLETAAVYKRLRDEHGMRPEEIADKVNKTRQHVDQLLHLADAPEAVQRMVADGAVSATEAMKLARKHGAAAADILTEQVGQAGGKRVTAKALKPWTPPAKVVVPLVETLDDLAEGIGTDMHARLIELEKKQHLEGVRMEVDAWVLWNFMQCYGEIQEARQKQAVKDLEKQNKAAQADLEDNAVEAG